MTTSVADEQQSKARAPSSSHLVAKSSPSHQALSDGDDDDYDKTEHLQHLIIPASWFRSRTLPRPHRSCSTFISGATLATVARLDSQPSRIDEYFTFM